MLNFFRELHPLIQAGGTIVLAACFFYLYVLLSEKINDGSHRQKKN